MTRHAPMYWVDAFASRPFAGNPAAVCLLDGPAVEAWMQGLATELGISETAFTWPEGDGRVLRWFTPRTEVALCGHATLATAHALREEGRATDGDVVAFRTRSGVLTARLGGPAAVELDLPADPPAAAEVPAALRALGPVAAAAGREDLVLELATAAEVRAADPDLRAVAALPYRAVCLTAPGDGATDADYVLRVFGPRVGIAEDPVTGSAQCVLGPYWAARTGRTVLDAAQLSARGGRLSVALAGARVLVGGGAVTVMAGRVMV